MKKNTILKISAITLPLMALTILTTSSVFAADASAADSTQTQAPIVLTDAQKAAAGQAYELRLNDKFAEAKQVLDAANVPKIKMPGKRGMMRGAPPKDQEEIRTAILNNDFTKYKELTKNRLNADKIDETAFAKLVQVHKLMDEGKMDEAKTIMDELGLKPGMGPDMGRGHGLGARTDRQESTNQ